MRKLFFVATSIVILSFALFVSGSRAEEETITLVLDEAIKIAIAENYRIKEVSENLGASAEERKSARADFLPKVSATYYYAGLKEEPFSRFGGSIVQTADRNQFHWDVTMIQPLFTGFALLSKYNISKLKNSISDEEKRQAILDIALDVKNAYFNLLLSQKMVAVASDEVNALTSQQDDALKFFDQGLIPRNDLLRSQVALANALQNLERAQANEHLALSQLNVLLARKIDHPTEITDITTPSAEDSYELSDLIEESMRQRPLLKITRLGIETLTKGITLARSSYYPKVSLVGCYEENGDNIETSNNDFNNRHNASVLVEAQWTFFEWGKTKADVAKVRHDKNALINKLKTIEDGVRLEIKDALLALRVAKKNIDTSSKALEQAKENWRITKLQYDQHIVASSDVLDARAYLTQADTNYYRSLYGYMTSIGKLERSVGKM